MNRKRLSLAVLAALSVVTVVLVGGALGATPGNGTVTIETNVSWTGGPYATSNPNACDGASDPTCDHFFLTVDKPATGNFRVDITLNAADPRDDYDVFLYGPDGAEVDSSTNGGTPPEVVTIAGEDLVDGATYEVRVLPWLVRPGSTYSAVAKMRPVATTTGSTDPNSVLWGYNPSAAEATVDAPLRVVLVGFRPNEFDASKLVGIIPDSQRPGVLNTRYDSAGGASSSRCAPVLGGNWQLVNHGRCYYEAGDPFLVPWQVNWKPQVIYAPDAFADGLFAKMAATATTGTLANKYTAYLEKYNATRGNFRGLDKLVAPNTPVRFIDAEKVEDWIAQNSRAHFGFDISGKADEPGVKPGYTVFVLNTWDSPLALKHLKPQHEYHTWKVVRIDPDTNTDEGINWARVWGGRYREMILDLGAAPNPYESETWGNNGDTGLGSAAYDPPLWEYRANAPRPIVPTEIADPNTTNSAISPGRTWTAADLAFNIQRFANEAASFRFAHSYLYEPRPHTGKYFLSNNIWHDANAMQPFESDLKKLFNEQAVLAGLRTLVPYFSFEGDTEYKKLTLTDPDQVMLDEAKRQGDDIAGAPGTAMYTVTAMNYLDDPSRRARFYRGGACATTVPNLNVVVEKHYAWSLPVIVAGIATNRAGVPWGFLASVSDLTKWSGADTNEITKAAHPQVFSGTFSYTAIHELSHYLGLAHPHDSVGASKVNGQTVYWDGFTWSFNSTAAPTTYSHDELTYSILDQENIARGHAAYYLRWANEALAEAGDAFAASGKETLDKLSDRQRTIRSAAVALMTSSRKDFARFRFVSSSFAAQKAWRHAAALRDLALKLPAGTTELQQGTKLSGAGGCSSAAIAG